MALRRLPLIAVALVASVTLSACGDQGPRADPTKGGFVSSNQGLTTLAPADRKAAPDIAGNDLYGRPLALSTFNGKVVVVNIWGSWCPPCRKEQPILSKVSKNLKAEGVQFLGIAVRESAAASRAFVEKRNVPYPSISDESGRMLTGFASSLPSVAIPTTYVIDRRGRVAARLVDTVTLTTLTDMVTDIAREP